MKTAEWAASYAARGWTPIPVPIEEKACRLAGWTTLTVEEGLAHFANGRRQNIAVALGAPSGNLVDIDIDAPEAIPWADYFLPETATFGRLGKRSSHRLFAVRGTIKTAKYDDVDGSMLIEVRSTGAQTVFPGSIHQTGQAVEWESAPEPLSIKAATLGRFVREFAAATILGRNFPADGGRHTARTALAGWFCKKDVPIESAVRIVNVASLMAGGSEETKTVEHTYRQDRAKLLGYAALKDQFDPRVLDRVASWLGFPDHQADLQAEQAKLARFDGPPIPFALKDRPPFPTAALPPAVREIVEAVAEETQTPVEMAALMALAVCAGAIARYVEVNPTGTWVEPTNIYAFVAMEPGERKSAVVSHIAGPVSRIENRITEETRAQVQTDAAVARALKDGIKANERKLAAAFANARLDEIDGIKETLAQLHEAAHQHERTRARPVRFLAGNATPEKLGVLIQQNDERISVYDAEGDLFDIMCGQYGAPNLTLFLKAHAGDTYILDRMQRESFRIERPALTMGVCVQPNVMRKLARTPEALERGLVARFLYAVPDSKVGARKVRDATAISPEVSDAWQELVTKLYQIKPLAKENGLIAPHRLGLHHGALDLLNAFRERVEAELGDWGRLAPVRAWGNKVAGAVVRLAAIIHVVEQIDDEWETAAIGADPMAAAIGLATDFLIPHAVSAITLMGGDETTAKAQLIMRWVARSQKTPEGWAEFTKRDLFNALRRSFSQRVELMDDPLRLLEAYGYLYRVSPPATSDPGRRRSDAFVVNPSFTGSVE